MCLQGNGELPVGQHISMFAIHTMLKAPDCALVGHAACIFDHLVVTHLQGVLAMSWSGHDAGLLLSSAKDNRTILWDVATGETLGELSAGNNWDFDVLWSPSNPGVFATSSYGAGEGNSGKVSLPPAAPFQGLSAAQVAL